jgi:hypothetical protein
MEDRVSKTNRAKAPDFIASKVPFKASALSGLEGSRQDTGMMPQSEAERYKDANPSYTVMSYGTPIAWHGDQGWDMSKAKHSSTTSRHQGIVRRAVFDDGHNGARQ